MSTTKPTSQLFQLAPMFPELLTGDVTEARVTFYECLLGEGAEEVQAAARQWGIEAPPHLTGEMRTQYLAGKVAEAEFPSVAPVAADAA